MRIIEKEVSKVLKDDSNEFQNYLNFLEKEGGRLENDNIVIDLSEVEKIEMRELLHLLPWSEQHRDRGRSFVIVAKGFSASEVPDELIVVPTLGEAEDLIQMDEIERDLGF